MKKPEYTTQIRLSVAIMVICFVLATITKQGIYSNIGWIISGCMFIINPVWSPRWDYKDHKYLRLGSRTGGIIAVIMGLITRFGV